MVGLPEKAKYLFICTLFNDATSISDYIASNDTASKQQIRKDVEGSGRGLPARIHKPQGKSDSPCPGRDPNLALPQYKSSGALPRRRNTVQIPIFAVMLRS
jgi:hypothetical protein